MEPFLKATRTFTENPDLEKFQMHTHETFEIYCFLSGGAKYFVEGNIYKLKPGDILIIKKAEAHSLLINSDAPYERIVVNFNAEALLETDIKAAVAFLENKPLGKYNRFSAARFNDKKWIYYLEKICSSEDFHQNRLYLTVLLMELRESFKLIGNEEAEAETATYILEYINNHLSEELSLDFLCERFYLSKSYINRKFKKITGSTVWEYILTKRLHKAKELLQNGERPTAVYTRCGFNDYCSFFRAYKKQFGSSPKDEKQKKEGA